MTFALSAPPTDFYAGVLIGLGLLYVSVATAPRARGAAARGFYWATAAGLVGMAFIPGVIQRFTPLGMAGGVVALVLLSMFQALAWAAGAAIAHALLSRRWLPDPLAFGAGVFVAISIPSVIAWTPASLMSPWPALVQLAELVGERGVSLVLAVAAALLVTPLAQRLAAPAGNGRRAAWLACASGAGLLALLVIFGALRMRAVREARAALPRLRVGVVQAAVPAKLRWQPAARQEIAARLHRLTLESERRGAELTIWPEAAYPYVLPHAAGPAPSGSRSIVGRGVRGPVLAGLITDAIAGGHHNSATIVGRDGWMQKPQAKMALLWFGETVPFSEYLPWLRKVFFRAGGLMPGSEVALLEDAGARIGVLNCYEDTLPAIGRRVARQGPNLLVNVTNDAWFGPTSEPELHLRLSVLRAVESRRDLVRAVNLGLPAWIDAAGSVRVRGSADQQSVLLTSPALNDMSPTLYVRAGDIPVWLGLTIATLGSILLARRRTRRQNATEPSLLGP